MKVIGEHDKGSVPGVEGREPGHVWRTCLRGTGKGLEWDVESGGFGRDC